MEYHIGDGLAPYSPYGSHILSHILTETRRSDPDDISDYGGKHLVPVKIKSFLNLTKFIDYILITEIFTEFIMEENDMEYKEASTFLYSKSLPTSHHIDLLRGDNDVMFSSIVKKGTEAKPSEGTSKIVQLVKKDILCDRNHTIVIFVNPHRETMNSEANAMLTVRRKGTRCENNDYNLKNTPLNYDEVLSVTLVIYTVFTYLIAFCCQRTEGK